MTLETSIFDNNLVTRGTGGNNGQCKGGAIFARDGAIVKGFDLQFTNNKADDASSQEPFNNRYGVKLDTNDVYGAIALKPNAIDGTPGSDFLVGTADSETISGQAGNDTLTGGGGQDTLVIRLGDGTDTITDFASVGTGVRPSAATVVEVDRLQFEGAGLTAQNMLLTQKGSDLAISFQGVDHTKVVLQNFALENLDNLQQATGASIDLGSILFAGQTTIQDRLDVFDADQQHQQIFNPNSVTFLNDLDNTIKGFDDSDDVINAQEGDDAIAGLSGDDLLRGRAGNDILGGGDGVDILRGGQGNDRLTGGNDSDRLVGHQGRDILMGGEGNDQFVYTSIADGHDLLKDFQVGSDKIVLKRLLQALDYQGSDPIADGYLSFGDKGADTLLQIDPDGVSGSRRSQSLALVEDVTVAALNNGSNFVF